MTTYKTHTLYFHTTSPQHKNSAMSAILVRIAGQKRICSTRVSAVKAGMAKRNYTDSTGWHF